MHEGAGGGSNYRIWRKISNHIIDGYLKDNDILIVQYTETVRNEFWSAFPDTRVYDQFPNQPKNADESHDNGTVIRYKYGAWHWQNFNEEKHFFTQYEKKSSCANLNPNLYYSLLAFFFNNDPIYLPRTLLSTRWHDKPS